LTELCDDGSDPEHKRYVTKEKNKDQSLNLRTAMKTQKVVQEFVNKCREVLAIVRDEA